VVEALKLSRSSKPTALAQLLAHQYTLWLSDYEEHYRRCVSQNLKAANGSTDTTPKAASYSQATEAGGDPTGSGRISPLKRKRDESDEELEKNGNLEIKAEGEANGGRVGGAESPAGPPSKYASFSCKRCNKSIQNTEDSITEHLDYHYARYVLLCPAEYIRYFKSLPFSLCVPNHQRYGERLLDAQFQSCLYCASLHSARQTPQEGARTCPSRGQHFLPREQPDGHRACLQRYPPLPFP
jgi:hypothetical protein